MDSDVKKRGAHMQLGTYIHKSRRTTTYRVGRTRGSQYGSTSEDMGPGGHFHQSAKRLMNAVNKRSSIMSSIGSRDRLLRLFKSLLCPFRSCVIDVLSRWAHPCLPASATAIQIDSPSAIIVTRVRGRDAVGIGVTGAFEGKDALLG